MFSPKMRKKAAECWVSNWRPVVRDAQGRPTKYIALTREEMFQAATQGSVRIETGEEVRVGGDD